MKNLSLLIAALLCASITFAQINIKDKIKKATNKKANEKVDQSIDKGLDEAEKSITGQGDDAKPSTETSKPEETTPITEQTTQEPAVAQKPKLESYTQYDFVPGDQIVYYDDFSQDAIGDFPANWTTNSSGEIKTLNIAPGKWLHINAEDGVHTDLNKIEFPTNFIFEFDVVPDDEFRKYYLILFQESEYKEFDPRAYPGDKGLYVRFGTDRWETNGYNNIDQLDRIDGHSELKPIVKGQVNHIIIWVQNRRLRIYHMGSKVLDLPTNIHANTKFNRFQFNGWDTGSKLFISNLKITTAAPDTRSKLITEGKLISYGIFFDSGKDVVKPESNGALKDIANVLKENPTVRIKIIGHTDSDGDDAANLDLSKRRAANVKKALNEQFQIDAARIETDGKGEGQPIGDNATMEGKAKNRRVEFLKL